MYPEGGTLTDQEIKDAFWAARLHAKTGTMLSDAAVAKICAVMALVECEYGNDIVKFVRGQLK